MVAVGFGILWWGYLEIVYGWCLLKGYDVTWKQLANPISPYEWPAAPGQPPPIPNTQILPGKPAKTTTAVTTGTTQPGSKIPNPPTTPSQTQLL